MSSKNLVEGPRPRRARTIRTAAYDWPDWTDRVRYGLTTKRLDADARTTVVPAARKEAE